jgi:hypothetical protein
MESSGFRDQLSVRQAHGADAASAIPLPASRCIGCSMKCTLCAVRTPQVQKVAAGLAASRWTVLTPVGRMSYEERQPSELANDNFSSERVRRAFSCLLGVSGERGKPTGDCKIKRDSSLPELRS